MEKWTILFPNYYYCSTDFSSVDKLVILSALRVDVQLNDIHDIYENTIMDIPCKFCTNE